jgi:hypothetical protein
LEQLSSSEICRIELSVSSIIKRLKSKQESLLAVELSALII